MFHKMGAAHLVSRDDMSRIHVVDAKQFLGHMVNVCCAPGPAIELKKHGAFHPP